MMYIRVVPNRYLCVFGVREEWGLGCGARDLMGRYTTSPLIKLQTKGIKMNLPFKLSYLNLYYHTLSSWCRTFSSRSRSRKIRIRSISKFFVCCCLLLFGFTKSCNLINFNSQSLTGESFVAIERG